MSEQSHRSAPVIGGPPAAHRRRSIRIRLDVVGGAVLLGDYVYYTVLNQTERPILAGGEYGFERRVALAWRSQTITEGRVCAGGPVEAGRRSGEGSAHVPEDFPPGRYRLTSSATPLDQNGLPISHGIWPVQIKLVSKAFRIRLPA
jgi:hypothetical protein